MKRSWTDSDGDGMESIDFDSAYINDAPFEVTGAGERGKIHFEHEALEVEDVEEDPDINRNNNLISMDKIHDYMAKSLLSDRLTRGFALFGNNNARNLSGSIFSSGNPTGPRKVATPSISLGRTSTMASDGGGASVGNGAFDPARQNEMTKKEILQDMADNTRYLFPLNRSDLHLCNFIFRNTPAIRNSMLHFKTQLFKKPFKVSIVYDPNASQDEETNAFETMTGEEDTNIVAALNKELEELIVQNKWTPMLEEHYKWQKLCGVVPIYFEPIGVKQRGNLVKIHYVPKIPLMDSGALYTYLDRRNRQNFVWEWTGNNGVVDVMDGSGGIDLNDIGANDGLGLGLGIGDTDARPRVYVKRSRYMFFDVTERDHAPTLSGELQSDFKSIVSEWKNIIMMRRQMIYGAEKGLNPENIIEFNPDLTKLAGNAENIEYMRLYLEYLKINSKNPPFGGLENFSSVFGEVLEPTTEAAKETNQAGEIFTNIAMLASTNTKTPYETVSKARENLLARGASNYADNELGLATSAEFAGISAPSNATSATMDKLKLEALNNPNGTVSQAFKQAANRSSYPSNAKRLDPFEKVANGPQPIIPNYPLEQLWARFDELVSSICDFPPELLKANGSGEGQGEKPETSTAVMSRMDIFKERIKKKAKTYEIFVRQLWVMAYAPFKRNTARDMQINRMFANIDPGVLVMFDQVRITIPVMPFMDYPTALKFYKDGFITIQDLYDFVIDTYSLPKKKMLAKDYKALEAKVQDGFDREDGLVLPPEPPGGKKKK